MRRPGAPAQGAGHRLDWYRFSHAGITQFIDVGAAIPTVGNAHDVAARLSPNIRVVYVDHDPSPSHTGSWSSRVI